MCLAIPACITEIEGDRMAKVDILGAQRTASLDLVPQAKVGDFVLVHAGFAIEVVDPQFAQETLDLIREFPELADEPSLQPSEPFFQGAGTLATLAEDPRELLAAGETRA